MDGRRIRNLFSGETMTIRRTSDEPPGDAVEMELELRPLGAPGGLPHRHRPAERFQITRGMLFVWIAGRLPQLGRVGDVIEVPPDRWHYLLAVQRSAAEVSIHPGMRFDELLARWAELGSGDLRPGTLLRLVRLLRQHGCI